MLYLTGPMSGISQYNRPAFNDAAARLRDLGYTVLNPAENGGAMPDDAPWEDWMRLALTQMLKCDALVLLNGWQRSRGAQLEHEVATRLNMYTAPLAAWIAPPPSRLHLILLLEAARAAATPEQLAEINYRLAPRMHNDNADNADNAERFIKELYRIMPSGWAPAPTWQRVLDSTAPAPAPTP